MSNSDNNHMQHMKSTEQYPRCRWSQLKHAIFEPRATGQAQSASVRSYQRQDSHKTPTSKLERWSLLQSPVAHSLGEGMDASFVLRSPDVGTLPHMSRSISQNCRRRKSRSAQQYVSSSRAHKLANSEALQPVQWRTNSPAPCAHQQARSCLRPTPPHPPLCSRSDRCRPYRRLR